MSDGWQQMVEKQQRGKNTTRKLAAMHAATEFFVKRGVKVGDRRVKAP